MAEKITKKEETITIKFSGSKKFRQGVVDRIYELLMEEEFMAETVKPGCGLTFESSIAPSEAQE